MIVLGIDPGTAALGYGIVERNGGALRARRLRLRDHLPDLPLGERLRDHPRGRDELIETHRPTLLGVERLFFSKNAQTAFAVGQARGVVLLAAAQHGVAVREATPNEVKVAVTGYGAADKEPGRPDGRHDPRARRGARRPTTRPTPSPSRSAWPIASGPANPPDAGVLDRAAIAPIARGESAYERAVREALAARTTERPRRGDEAGPVIASVEGVVGAIATDSLVHRGRRDRLPGLRVAVRARRSAGRRPAQAPHAPPRPRGPAGAVRLPDGRGARVLQPAPDRDRRRAEGRPGDRRAAGPWPTSSWRSSSRTRRCS